MKNRLYLIIIIQVFTFTLAIAQKENKPEINVVYGDKHIFTIETPTGWVNDKQMAEKIGLVCFFYPIAEKDSLKKNFFFANGIDKESSSENLKDYVTGDLIAFKKKYPDYKYETTPLHFDGGITSGIMYTFSNLHDKYIEEVVYLETDDSFIIFTYSANSAFEYNKYLPFFDGFIQSFNYMGNNPQPFLDYMKSMELNE